MRGSLEPNTSMEVVEGDSVLLSVFAKYESPKRRGKREALFPKGGAERLISDLGELSRSGLVHSTLAILNY